VEGNNKAFTSPQESANWWETTFGGELSDHPTTIQGFLQDLQNNNPLGKYNSVNPDWATSIQGGAWTVDHGPGARAGQHTKGSYQSLVDIMKKCGITIP